MAENEVVFRQLNEQLQKGIDETNQVATEDNQPQYIITPKPEDPPLYFYCECSDENCAERLLINHYEYTRIHKQRDHFTVIPGHEVTEVENVICKESGYSIVEKIVTPPETVSELHVTDVDNS